MLFSSHEYLLLFLPLSVILYFLLHNWRATRIAKAWLVLASLFFYGWWNPKYIPLILFSILMNFAAGTLLTRMRSKGAFFRKSLLVAGISLNVILLGYFKYYDFLVETSNAFFGTHGAMHHLILPLGISFFTFTQIAFLVDTYRKDVEEYSLMNYFLFVTFFPHLIAGPIIHHAEMMPQFKHMDNAAANYRNLSVGIFLVSMGLIKKVLIADRFGEWVSAGFDHPEALNLLSAWATSLSYTFQIYFDFSGYTDMALGAALMFNIVLPINFNSPYKALDIQDFWRRWHITLSRFLREYIYIPLGGNRTRETLVYANLMVTFLIGGLWHGAGWTFLFWGFLHGAAILVHRAWKKTGFTLPRWLAWLVTFNFVNMAWVFFRAKSWGDAIGVLKAMSGLQGTYLPDLPVLRRGLAVLSVKADLLDWKSIMGSARDAYLFIIPAVIFCLVFKNSNELAQRFEPGWKTMCVVATGLYALLHIFNMSEFLYFNF